MLRVVAKHSVYRFSNTVNSLFVERRKVSICSFIAGQPRLVLERTFRR